MSNDQNDAAQAHVQTWTGGVDHSVAAQAGNHHAEAPQPIDALDPAAAAAEAAAELHRSHWRKQHGAPAATYQADAVASKGTSERDR